mmetsp:Transcript_65972/g.184405  ORF Transcript_65972/g.184405 Transcript_65972/m.184405 type:complete len:532 (-) Transcript_65972:27-1622(-)
MNQNNDRDGGNSGAMGAGTNGSTVNFQLASQLLSAISSGLASGHHDVASKSNAQIHGHQPHHTMNSTAEAAGQLLLQHLGLQQAAQQRSGTANTANHSSPPNCHAGVHSKDHGKSGHRSSEKDHHKKNHSDKAMPGTYSIVPCRARAMPPEHNSTSAVFEIARDVRHGENLLCSFPQCRNEGVKFAYCLVCGIPVAKRNFRQRHEHGGGMAISKGKERKSQPHSNGNNHASAVDASQLPSRRRHQHERPRSQDGDAPRNPFEQRDSEQGGGQRSDEAPMKNLVFQRRTGQNPETIVDSSNDDEVDRQRRWTELLRRRPLDTEGDEMSKWLLAVLEISDPGGNSSDANNNAPSKNDQHDSSASNEASNENESSSYEGSAGSGASGGAGWNSSSETIGSGDSSGPSESSSGGTNGRPQDGNQDRRGRMAPQHQYVAPFQRQQNLPVVSDFRNSTESPSGSTDAGGVDTTTNDPTSGSGSNDDTLPREASSSLSGSMGSSESGSAFEKNSIEEAKRPASSSPNEMHVEKKMKHR